MPFTLLGPNVNEYPVLGSDNASVGYLAGYFAVDAFCEVEVVRTKWLARGNEQCNLQAFRGKR